MNFFNRRSNNVYGEDARPRRKVGCLGGCLIFLVVYFLCCGILGWLMGDMFSSSTVELKDKTN